MHESDNSHLINIFSGIVGAERTRVQNENELRVARMIVEPAQAEQIAEVVRKCESDRLSLAAMGAGRTLAEIRCEPAMVGISLARINRIVDYEPDDMTIVAQAGLTLGV